MFLEKRPESGNSLSSRIHLRILPNAHVFQDRVLVVGHADKCGRSNTLLERKFSL
jgi:hypothetical protein